MRKLTPIPLTPEAFEPFGRVVMVAPPGVTPVQVNQGTAQRYDRILDLENRRPNATLNVASFRSRPREEWPTVLSVLEKHPYSSQLFVPMAATRYVCVAARGKDYPDVSTLTAFLADGRQGISWLPDVWHHTLLSLDYTTDFACFVYEDATPGDCITVELRPDERVALSLE
jgi:ureidoglycolate lyase